MEDREYQSRTIERIRDCIRRGFKRILVVLPTGAGKGFLAARVMQMAAQKESENIFFADQRELITQLGRQLNRMDVPCSTLMAGVENEYGSAQDANSGALCVVAAKDTLWARAFRSDKIQPPPAKIIQVDEAHKSLAKTWQSVAEYYDGTITIGWTATPCRTDGRGLGDVYETMIVAATYSELQRDGWLVPIRAFAPDRPDLKGLKVSRGDYVKKGLEQRMNRDEMVGCAVTEWKKHSQDRSTVVFASGVQHSIHLRNEFRKIGVSAEHVDGKMCDSERDDIMHRAAEGDILVLCNYGVLHTGVDVPAWKYLICMRPTKSFQLWRQMGGRIQRPLPGHDHAMIQDHSDNCLHFGFPDEDVDWTLETTEKIQEKHAKKQREKNKQDPYACEKCSAIYRGPHCPKCGHKPERKGEGVKTSKGELKELERRKANSAATPMDKQKTWDECLGWAIGTGRTVGVAAKRYKDKYGVWPRGLQEMPRGSQWRMDANEFYREFVKPERARAKDYGELESSEAF